MKTIKRPIALAADDPRRFKIHTGAVRAIERDVEQKDGSTVKKKFIEGTASSTVTDRYGDSITEAAQLKMMDASKGMTMWLNHRYTVPEDILGSCEDATLERGMDSSEGACLDLLIRCAIDEDNPRALKSWQHIEGGRKLGFSIGGYFTDVEFKDEDDWWSGYIVNDVELLEISLVGIPANPRAYTKFVEWMTNDLREHAKAFASGLAPEADRKAARVEFTKSLFGPGDDEDGDVDVATSESTSPLTVGRDTPSPITASVEVHNAEECARRLEQRAIEPNAVFTEYSKTLMQRAAEIIRAKIVKNDGKEGELNTEQQLRCVEALKCIRSATDHGLCVDGYSNASAAHAHVKALLPTDYELPGDATLPDDEPAVDRGAHLDGESERKTLDAQLEQKKSELDKLGIEAKDLEKKIAELKATPTGRRSAYSGGSLNSSEASVTPEMYRRTTAELERDLGRAMTSDTSDARTRAAST